MIKPLCLTYLIRVGFFYIMNEPYKYKYNLHTITSFVMFCNTFLNVQYNQTKINIDTLGIKSDCYGLNHQLFISN